jgi:DNA-binding NarL/FixJ family response regulator
LIEDNAVFLGLLTAFLERAPASEQFSIAGSARTGAEGIAAVARLHPAAVIVDLKLPGISGFDVITQLRRANSGIAIIALTSADPAAFRDPALAAGADAFVTKDGMHAELLAAMRTAIHARTNPVTLADHVNG